MMNNLVCQNSWSDNEARGWRMILALVEHDEDAYDRVIDEIKDCPACLVNALHHAMRGWAAYVALGAGSHAEAADLAAQELERQIMR